MARERETSEERRARKEREKERAREKESRGEKEGGKSKEKEREKSREKDRDKGEKKEKKEKDKEKESKDRDSKKESASSEARAANEAMRAENEKVKEKKEKKEKEKEKDRDKDRSDRKKEKDEKEKDGKKDKDDKKEKEKDKKDEKSKSRRDRDKPVNKLVVDAEKAQRQAIWDKSMARGQSLLRVLELDVATLDCPASDIQPLTEYELFITAYGGADRTQAAVQAPPLDDLADRYVQTDEIKQIDRKLTMPDDFGLFVRTRAAARRQAAIDKVGTGGDDDPLRGGSGGDALRFEAFDVDHDALARFLSRTYPIFHTILDESLNTSLALMGAKKTKRTEFSVAYTTLAMESVLGARSIVYTAFSSLQPQYLLTVYGSAGANGTPGTGKPEAKEELDVPFTEGVVAIWNVNNPLWPDRVLAAPCALKVATFSPTRPYIIYGGGMEGQVMVWDLREPDHMHTTGLRSSFGVRKHEKKKKEKKDDKKERKEEEQGEEKGLLVLRYPTHTTQWEGDVAHPYPIHALVVEGSTSSYVPSNLAPEDAVGSAHEEEGESVAALDQGGILSFWVLQDLPGGEHIIAERDYGLAPFARVKLLRSSLLEVRNPDRVTGKEGGVAAAVSAASVPKGGKGAPAALEATGAQRTLETLAADYMRQVGTAAFAFIPKDSSRHLIGTDTGFIVHANRFNALVQPPHYYSAKPNQVLNLREQAIQLALPRDLKYGTTCMAIAFCPTNPDFFVAGFSDGSVSLYFDGLLQPLFTFGAFTSRPITQIAWSHSWKGVFFALSDEGTFYTFDLMNDDIDKRKDVLLADELAKKEKGSEDGVVYPTWFDVSWDKKGDSRIAVAYGNGSVAVHVLKDSLFSEQQRNQDFFLTIDTS